MHISHYCLVWPVNFSNEKIQESRKNFFLDIFLREKKILGICELFKTTSHLTNIIPIPIQKFWNS